MNKRETYRTFCVGRPDIPVFSQPWWLDVVCGEEGWDVCIVENAGRVVATLPYRYETSHGAVHISMPGLTQSFRLWIDYTDATKLESRLSREKQVITELIRQLPTFESFVLNLHPSLTNWLPFYWQGFTQTTRYTYVIDDLTDLPAVFARFSHAKRKNLKRADEIVKLGPELTAQEYYKHHTMTMQKSGKVINYPYSLLEAIFRTTRAHECGKVYTAIDSNGRIHSAIFVMWDPEQAFYLLSSIDPDHRTSGATTFLLKQAITEMREKTKRFDFEGSMIEGVENSFRQFGTKQIPYFQILKFPPPPTSLGGFAKTSLKFRWTRARSRLAARFRK